MDSIFEYLLSNGHKVVFRVESGTVIDFAENTNSITTSGKRHLRSIGGRLVSTPGAIDTELVTSTKLWLKKGEGVEYQVDVSEVAVPVRIGHEVVLIREMRGGLVGDYMGMLNKNSQKVNTVLSQSLESQRKYGGGRPKGTGWKILFFTPLVCFLATLIMTHDLPYSVLSIFVPGLILAAVVFLASNFLLFDKRAKIIEEVHVKAQQALETV